MKVVKIVLLIIWGFFTFGLLILIIIQRQENLISTIKFAEQKEILKESNLIKQEYARNFKTIQNHPDKTFAIDSIYKNSKYLKSITGKNNKYS